MSKESEARENAARAKRNQEMASDLITRVEHSQARHRETMTREQ